RGHHLEISAARAAGRKTFGRAPRPRAGAQEMRSFPRCAGAIGVERPLQFLRRETGEDTMRNYGTPLRIATFGLTLAACSSGNQAVKPDEMSAAAHHEEARREGQAARSEVGKYRAGAGQPRPFSEAAGGDYLTSVPIYNPT